MILVDRQKAQHSATVSVSLKENNHKLGKEGKTITASITKGSLSFQKVINDNADLQTVNSDIYYSGGKYVYNDDTSGKRDSIAKPSEDRIMIGDRVFNKDDD